MSSINDKLIQLGETKNLIKNAIISKGVNITPDTPFRDYASKIGEISTTTKKRYWYFPRTNGYNNDSIITYSNRNNYILPELSVSGYKGWEFFLKFKKGGYESTSSVHILGAKNHYDGLVIYAYSDNSLGFGLGNGSSSWIFDGGHLLSQPNTDWFYVRVSHPKDTGTYTIQTLDDSGNLHSSHSYTGKSSTDIINSRLLGSYQDGVSNPRVGDWSVDLQFSYILIEGEYYQGKLI